MRICIFGQDLPAFEQKRLALLAPVAVARDADTVLLTNSRGLPPADGTHVHVTSGAATGRMRALRWLIARHERAFFRAATAVVSPLAAPQLMEGLRAADPDVIVALDPSWAAELRKCIRGYHLPWPCLATGEPLPLSAGRWRRYDPALKVSIVLPTYNGTRYLSESLESCFAQSHHAIEVVVVDDGSGPEVAEIVGSFSGPRLKYVRHDTNRGLPAALNTGFAEASGALLTWTSDDNLYTPDAIEQMVRFLCTYPDVDFVYSDAYEIDAEGKVVGMLRVPPPEWLRVKNRVGGSFMYRRRVYEALGDYDPGAVLAEDYDYWLRVARRFTMQRLFRSLYYYRYHPRSLTASCARQQVKGQAERVRLANKGWRRNSRVGGAP
ncbi:MAG: glycosyltransferase family 2 protein [Acidobacteriota bacterium]|nr:glycosyltransferase family 2 protein [Acidobacteriota bacterium]